MVLVVEEKDDVEEEEVLDVMEEVEVVVESWEVVLVDVGELELLRIEELVVLVSCKTQERQVSELKSGKQQYL